MFQDDEFGEKLYEEPSIDDILSFINDTSEGMLCFQPLPFCMLTLIIIFVVLSY